MISFLRRLCKSALFPIIWTIIILVLLTIPGNNLPSMGLFGIKNFDKVAHVILFGGFVLFWAIYSCYWKNPKTSRFQAIFLIMLISIAIGVVMEFVQKYWIPNRSFDIGDIWADAAGSGLVFLFLRVAGKRIGLIL